MNNFVGKWGLYQWFEEHGINLVHPDDLNAFRALMPNGKVFECEAENEFLTLRYGNMRYRVKPELFKPVEEPKYRFGQHVIIKDCNVEATIDEIQWHFNNMEPMFFVNKEHKRLTKRFWTKDLMPVFS